MFLLATCLVMGFIINSIMHDDVDDDDHFDGGMAIPTQI